MDTDLNGFTIEQIQQQLGIILQSADFNASARNRAFLDYVVQETVEGRSERIKAYNIATTILGRRENFDPQQDSIVRIEAGRLRRSLERYYLTSGVTVPLRIMIPTGTYVPAFVANPPRATERQVVRPFSVRVAVDLPSLRVVPFEEEGDQSAMPNCSRGFVRQVIVGLTKLSPVCVFGSEAAFGRDIVPSLGLPKTTPDVDYVLTGGTSLDCDHFCVEALLVDAQSGRIIWAEFYQRNLHEQPLTEAKDQIARAMVQALSGAIDPIVADAPDTNIPNAATRMASVDRAVTGSR